MYLFGTTTRLGKAVECVCEDFFESAYFLRTYHCLREYCLEGEIARIMYSQPIAVVGALTLVTDIADTTASWWHGSCGRVSKGPSVWWCIRHALGFPCRRLCVQTQASPNPSGVH